MHHACMMYLQSTSPLSPIVINLATFALKAHNTPNKKQNKKKEEAKESVLVRDTHHTIN